MFIQPAGSVHLSSTALGQCGQITCYSVWCVNSMGEVCVSFIFHFHITNSKFVVVKICKYSQTLWF